MSREKNNAYRATLNLPTTEFSIRAHAREKEPEILKYWEENNLAQKSYEHNNGAKRFLLHDGPPYANGHIHMGTTVNKTLKDIICKSRRMAGYHVPYKPGWDCHGLPIELKVAAENSHVTEDRASLKAACRSYADRWIDIQQEEFKNLGVFADWENPYKTMEPGYEANIVRAFGTFVANGYIKRKNKTVPWCPSCQTALATVEIEYKERKDPSCYILFSLVDDVTAIFGDIEGITSLSFLVWTTTPWTIPLNRAVVLRPDAQYVALAGKKPGEAFIVGEARADDICSMLGIEKHVLATCSSRDFERKELHHPLVRGLTVPVLLDEAVSTEEGTACMHMAPGCGPEDYTIAVREGIDIFSPLAPDGTYAKGIAPPELEGMSVADGQLWVIKKLAAEGTLYHKASLRHPYPHCWRCRGGLMFRATLQWFCDLQKNDLVKKALEAIDSIEFVPKTGKSRLHATISSRTEWCISRQRVWGTPIISLLCSSCDEAYLNPTFIDAVAKNIEQEGIEYWDRVPLDELRALSDLACAGCGNTEAFTKETDILDVWFDAGVSHFAVLDQHEELQPPADVYFEGSDQHRGWFQSSLLTSMILRGRTCSKSIITHGYVVDGDGHKMSKSLGNVVAPSELIEKFSRDIVRLWAASCNYEGDIIISDAVMKNAAEVYRKIRNTARFLLSNLYDFDVKKDAVDFGAMLAVDQYALARLQEVHEAIVDAYLRADTPSVFHGLGNYCATDLSSFYLDIIKDRLYVENAHGFLRRSAQTACYHILDALTRLLAPTLSFLAEELTDHYQHDKRVSIHLQSFAQPSTPWSSVALHQHTSYLPGASADIPSTSDVQMKLADIRNIQWGHLASMRGSVLKAIEERREMGEIRHSLEAKVTLHLVDHDDTQQLKAFFADLGEKQTVEQFLCEFFIVSQCTFVSASEGLSPVLEWLALTVDHADGAKCPRCWQWDETQHPQGVCRRCEKVMGGKS